MLYESCFLRGDAKKGWKGVLKYKDADGNWRQRQRKLNSATKRDARRELDSWRAEMEAEASRAAQEAALGYVPGETVHDYMRAYIDGREHRVERSTYCEYGRLLSSLIDPYIGNIELDALNPDAVQVWVNRLMGDYAPATVRKGFVLLRSGMKQAVERDRLAKDPTRTVQAPRKGTPKPNALDERGRGKVARFIAIDPASPVNIGIALALYMGMREGEICGLRWQNVDIARSTLKIVEAIGQAGGEPYVKDPKNVGSRRELPMPAVVAEALASRRASMDEERFVSGLPLDSLYVTGGVDGSYMRPHYLSTRWRRVADALELVGTQGRRPTFHDLRHSYATAAIAHGVDVKTVSSSMGHANAAMTLNTYASADPDAKRRGAEAVAAAIADEAGRLE